VCGVCKEKIVMFYMRLGMLIITITTNLNISTYLPSLLEALDKKVKKKINFGITYSIIKHLNILTGQKLTINNNTADI
jgi:hypothetical protein